MSYQDRYSKQERSEYNKEYWNQRKTQLRKRKKADTLGKLRRKKRIACAKYQKRLMELLQLRDDELSAINREIYKIESVSSKQDKSPENGVNTDT